MSRAATIATILALLVGGALEAQPPKTLKKSYLGKQFPDFKPQKKPQKGNQKGNWTNAPGNMSLKHIHGRPTLICYTTLG